MNGTGIKIYEIHKMQGDAIIAKLPGGIYPDAVQKVANLRSQERVGSGITYEAVVKR